MKNNDLITCTFRNNNVHLIFNKKNTQPVIDLF